MAVGTQIGVAAGTQTVDFDPLITPIHPVGDLYTVHVACKPGTALSFRATGSPYLLSEPVPIASSGLTIVYLGFNAQEVITPTAYPIELQFGYRSVLDVDLVAIWQVGRFRLPSSDALATINVGDLVYPSKNTPGLLANLANTATNGTNPCPAYGFCVRAPATAGADMDVEIMLLGGRSILGS